MIRRVRWTWRFINMKSIWDHIFITSYKIHLNYINVLWTSHVLHMKFIWTSHEFHMKWNQIYSYEIHNTFIWTSFGVQTNLLWISYRIKSNLFIWIYMQFVLSSYELHIEELMKLICYTHVIQTCWHDAHKQFAWNTYEIHMNFEWFELRVNFIKITWQVHKKFLCTTHENGHWHSCTSYEWASRSIVEGTRLFRLILCQSYSSDLRVAGVIWDVCANSTQF